MWESGMHLFCLMPSFFNNKKWLKHQEEGYVCFFQFDCGKNWYSESFPGRLRNLAYLKTYIDFDIF